MSLPVFGVAVIHELIILTDGVINCSSNAIRTYNKDFIERLFDFVSTVGFGALLSATGGAYGAPGLGSTPGVGGAPGGLSGGAGQAGDTAGPPAIGGAGGINTHAQLYGDYGRGGKGGDQNGSSVAGKDGYCLVEY